MIPQIVLALIAMLAAGIVLLVLGVRGRRLNDHPICRLCSFDLSGCAPGNVTCPECGAGLKRDRAIRIGQRRRVYSAIVFGMLAILIPVAAFGLVGYALATATDINSYKPLGLLCWEARHADAERGERIAKELHRRAIDRKLNEEQYARVIEAALEHQADSSRPWSETWGDIMEQGRLDDTLSPEQELRFLRHAPAFKWSVRKRLAQGKHLPILIDVDRPRVGASTSLLLQMRLLDASVDGRLIGPTSERARALAMPIGIGYAEGSLAGRRSLRRSAGRLMLSLPADLEPGEHQIAIRINVVSGRYVAGQRISFTHEEEVHPFEWRGTVEILAKDRPVAEPIEPTPEITEQLTQLLAPDQTMITVRAGSAMLIQRFGSGELPVPVAYVVLWREADREYEIGTLTTGREAGLANQFTASLSHRMVTGHASPDIGDVVDVILRPRADVAESTVDLDRYYGGEIVFTGVPVQRRVGTLADP